MKFQTILWRCNPHKGYVSIFVLKPGGLNHSPIKIASGTSRGNFTEIAFLYGMDLTRILIATVLTGILLELPLLEFLSALVKLFAQARDISPPGSDEDTELLDLAQNF